MNCKEIILRDFVESDIASRIRWETEETEWQMWDAPWEYDGLTEEDKRQELEGYVAQMQTWPQKYRDMPEDEMRYAFQIETADGQYIGWVSAYCIDDTFTYTDGNGHIAIGIDIPEMSARGKGYAYAALCAFIGYLRTWGVEEIYTQTWSGNARMIHIAQKMGFEECCRKTGIRQVRGGIYDGVTFRLNMEKFEAFSVSVMK